MTVTARAPKGWGTQGVLMGIFGAIGIAVVMIDGTAEGLAGALRGIVAAAYWSWFGTFGVLSTLSFPLLRRSHAGFLVGNLALVALAAAVSLKVFLTLATRSQVADREEAARDASATRERAARCGSLQSWRIVDSELGPRVQMTVDPHIDGQLWVGASGGDLAGRGLYEPTDQKTRVADYSVRANIPLNVDIALRHDTHERGTPFKLFFCCKVAASDPSSTCAYFESFITPAALAGNAHYLLPPPL